MIPLGKFWLVKEFILELTQTQIHLRYLKTLKRFLKIVIVKLRKILFSFTNLYLYQPRVFESIDDVIFDERFEETLFRSKSGSDLS